MVVTALLLSALAATSPAAVPEASARVEFPDIEMADETGQRQRLAAYRGAVTVLNFWATWCGPCRYELPELEKLANEFGGKGVVVLAVNVDGPISQVKRFIANTNLTLPVVYVDGRTQASLGIDRIPFTVVLDREGRAVRAYAGYSAAAMKDLRELVPQLLREKAAKGGS